MDGYLIRRHRRVRTTQDGYCGGNTGGGPFGGLKSPPDFHNTTGTWPSPYWLFHSDTVWRGGGDVGYRGKGSRRQQWITYRDWLGYGIRTRRGPLFPFNSLKFQSVMCARLSLAAELGADLRDLTDDIRMAAASRNSGFFVRLRQPRSLGRNREGDQLGQRNADVLAAAAASAATGRRCGSSWTRVEIVALSLPGKRSLLSMSGAFDLPATAARRYVLRTPWKQRGPASERRAEAGRPVEFRLSPWEVLVLEAQPMH